MTKTLMTPDYLIETLGLRPHPEGGWFTETWRGDEAPRAAGSAIYFLLRANESSHWHKVDAAEIWHWYAGSALALHIHKNDATCIHTLGTDFHAGQRPQITVPTNAWQKAEPIDGWVLVGCTVSPGFEFSGFELAEPDWTPA